MKIILVLLCLFNSLCNINFAQCNWNQIFYDDYEYSTVCNDLIPGMTYQNYPEFYSPHSGSQALYLNIVDGAIGLLYERTIDSLCPNTDYQISFWAKDAWDWWGNINLDFTVLDANNQV